MRNLFPVLFTAFVLSGCGANRPPAPAQSVPLVIADCPAMDCPATPAAPATVAVPAALPAVPGAVVAPVVVAPVVGPVLDLGHLDSLLTNMEGRLDTVQRLAVPRVVRAAFHAPPVCGPLCPRPFVVAVWQRDTGGVPLAVVSLPPPEATAPAPAPAGVPLPPRFYDPRGWPYWLLVALGAIGGAGLTLAIKRASL